jgi:hypothetical protein
MIITSLTQWYCPNCPEMDVTRIPGPHSRFHVCRGLRGLTAPMVEVGRRAKVSAMDRDDYVGKELVQVDGNGRPVMSVVTEYDDGRRDTAVYAPTAVGSIREE